MTNTKAYGWASLSHPSRGSVGCGWAGERRGEERRCESERERLVGDGQPVWGEGGVLSVVEEALRCFSEEFFPPIPPLQSANTTPPC